MGLGPQLVGHGSPVVGIGVGFGRQMLHALGRLRIGGVGARLVNHLLNELRVFQHGAGAEHVLVEGLVVMVGHEHGGLQALQQALVVAQKESNKILTEAKTQAHDMIESAKTEQVRLAEQSASECERIVKEHKEKCAELIRTNTEITEKKINEVRAAYDEELAKFENLKAEVTQFKADLTQLYNKQIRLIMEIPASEPAEDTAEEYEEEETVEETQEAAEEQAEETAEPEETVEAESAPVTDSEHVEKILNTGSFDPVIPKTAPAELKFGKNN